MQTQQNSSSLYKWGGAVGAASSAVCRTQGTGPALVLQSHVRTANIQRGPGCAYYGVQCYGLCITLFWSDPDMLLGAGRAGAFGHLISDLFAWWRYILWDRIFMKKRSPTGKKW